MCSIIGAIKVNQKAKIDYKKLQKLYEKNISRGGSGQGIWSPKKGLTKGLKLKCYGEYEKRKNENVIISHLRYATSGSTSDEHCHPFETENTVFVHNGHISNYQFFNVAMDSLAGLKMIENGKELEKLDGWYVFVWYNKKTKRLHMVSSSGHIEFTTEKGIFYFASIGIKDVFSKGSVMPDGYHLTFKLCDFSEISLTELPQKELEVEYSLPRKVWNRYTGQYEWVEDSEDDDKKELIDF